MDLRLLHYFVAVGEELHFGRAAHRLHIAQPSLSVQIRKLEHSLGVTLLARSSRHVDLTPAGQTLLDEARRLLSSAEQAVENTRVVAGLDTSNLVVGFQANAAAELTPRILASFQASHPNTRIDMRAHGFADPTVGLSTGNVDVAFVRPPLPWDGFTVETLFVEPRILALSNASPLAEADQLTVDDVVDEPFVARKAPACWRDFWLATNVRTAGRVRVGAEVSDVDECFEAILSGQGIAFTQTSTQRYYDRPGLSFVPMRGLPASSLAIAWRTDRNSPLVHEFVDTARAVASLGLVPDAAMSTHLTPTGTTSSILR